MAAPQIVMSGKKPPQGMYDRQPSATSNGAHASWTLLGLAGIAFFAVGVLDLMLAWIPAAFDSAAWEFATITASMNGLPLPAMGLILFLCSAIARESRWQARATSILLVLLSILVLAGGLLFATVAPAAFAEVEHDLLRTGLVKAVTKTGLLTILFPVLFLIAARIGWRNTPKRN